MKIQAVHETAIFVQASVFKKHFEFSIGRTHRRPVMFTHFVDFDGGEFEDELPDLGMTRKKKSLKQVSRAMSLEQQAQAASRKG